MKNFLKKLVVFLFEAAIMASIGLFMIKIQKLDLASNTNLVAVEVKDENNPFIFTFHQNISVRTSLFGKIINKEDYSTTFTVDLSKSGNYASNSSRE